MKSVNQLVFVRPDHGNGVEADACPPADSRARALTAQPADSRACGAGSPGPGARRAAIGGSAGRLVQLR